MPEPASENPVVLNHLPASVQIGYRTYQVEPLPEHETANYKGHHNLDKGKICIAINLDLQEAAKVFLHELLHALWHTACLPDGEAISEENTVERLTNGLALAMQQNPGLMARLETLLLERME